ncbi:MAG: type II secretion system minor pseudopilin GspI [Porticoccaceae bacterium]|jgi:type II secretion system protein I|nr:type II secretion system minor pseudopilin GspI [Porticoccaceae bacterium]
MNSQFRAKLASGFTLIEVAVALAILSWVLGSALYVVHQYSDERLKLRERFFSTQVSWNRLIERYQDSQGWVPDSDRSARQTKGIEEQIDQTWRWEMEIKSAMGEDLYRYEVKAGSEDTEAFSGSLSVYLIGKPSS